MPLFVFPGPFPDDAETRALRAATREGPVQLRAFSTDFAHWLAASALSISLAGYNTTVQLLASGVRSVVVPDPEMSDQGPRARRLAELGLATVVEPGPDPVEAIAAAVEAALARPRPRHGLDLGGVAATRAIIETLGAASEAGRARPRPASTSG
jgi:predicted glycosyltransferase